MGERKQKCSDGNQILGGARGHKRPFLFGTNRSLKILRKLDQFKLIQFQFSQYCISNKRYRRQDAIGTPFCITVDHQSLEDNTVTIRDRDTMEQKRIAISGLKNLISDKVDMKNFL